MLKYMQNIGGYMAKKKEDKDLEIAAEMGIKDTKEAPLPASIEPNPPEFTPEEVEQIRKDSFPVVVEQPLPEEPTRYVPAMTLDKMKVVLNAERDKRNYLLEFIRNQLMPGEDYGMIHRKIGTYPNKRNCKHTGKMVLYDKEGNVLFKCPDCGTKFSLFKPGAEEICGFLRLKPKFFVDKDSMEALGLMGKGIIYICRLYDEEGRWAEEGGEGRGARLYDPTKDDPNVTVKMCQKSSHIDVTLRIKGLSGMFTQDTEELYRIDKDWEKPSTSVDTPPDTPPDTPTDKPSTKSSTKSSTELPETQPKPKPEQPNVQPKIYNIPAKLHGDLMEMFLPGEVTWIESQQLPIDKIETEIKHRKGILWNYGKGLKADARLLPNVLKAIRDVRKESDESDETDISKYCWADFKKEVLDNPIWRGQKHDVKVNKINDWKARYGNGMPEA